MIWSTTILGIKGIVSFNGTRQAGQVLFYSISLRISEKNERT